MESGVAKQEKAMGRSSTRSNTCVRLLSFVPGKTSTGKQEPIEAKTSCQLLNVHNMNPQQTGKSRIPDAPDA